LRHEPLHQSLFAMLLGLVGHLEDATRALPAMRERVDHEDVNAIGEELLDRFEIAPRRVRRSQFANDKPARHFVAVKPGPARLGVENADPALGADHATGDTQGGEGLAAARRPVELDQQMRAGALGRRDVEDAHRYGLDQGVAKNRSARCRTSGSGSGSGANSPASSRSCSWYIAQGGSPTRKARSWF